LSGDQKLNRLNSTTNTARDVAYALTNAVKKP